MGIELANIIKEGMQARSLTYDQAAEQAGISRTYIAKILQGDGNLWWSGATNLGVRYALEHGFAYVLTINNDSRVSPAFLSELVKTARLPGLCSPLSARDWTWELLPFRQRL